MTPFPRLFEPPLVGGVTARNRDLDYYVARAKGGVGLLITGERLVHPTSPVGRPRFAYSYLPSMIERDRVTTKAVHQHDTLIFAQLNHVGLEGSSDAVDDLRFLYGPSEISSPLFGETGRPMDLDDIEDVEMRCAPTRISSLPSSPVRDGLGEDPVHVEDAARVMAKTRDW